MTDNSITLLKQVQGDVLVVYVYQLKKDPSTGEESVSVEKVSYRKNVEPPDNAAATADGS